VSAQPATSEDLQRRYGWLPRWLRPGTDPPAGARGDRRLVEGFVLLAIGGLLAAATIGDLARAVRINHRISHDEHTFYAYAHYHPKKVTVTPGIRNTRDIACGPTSHTARVQLCLVVAGPANAPLRTIVGGFYLPLRRPQKATYRYGCYGYAAAHSMCRASGPLYAPATPAGAA
jgi:hypothetical protein